MEPLYNILFAGEILEGQERTTVRARLGQLFKASDAVLDKLFSGQPQIVKRECDKATALKYKQAMERAGAKPLIAAAKASKPKQPLTERKLDTAARIAALAAAPDITYPAPTQPAGEPELDENGEPPRFTLSPIGSYLTEPEQREEAEEKSIDLSSYSTDAEYERLENEAPPAPPAPDTDHYAMGEVGESIPNLPREPEPEAPDISAIGLSPQGTDFSDCAQPDPGTPDMNLADYCLAPEGSEVLEPQYRQKHTAAAPDTRHLSLSEQAHQ